ncbi:MAG: hypothetical protein K1X55_13445 [Chitinophagales bacterium]|nr:hypothetical protein [Chitinophagales bacterium]
MPTIKKYSLSTGKEFKLIKINNDLIPDYYILAFPKSQGEPTPTEVTEMLETGIKIAKEIALELLNDEEAYTLLYSGYSARREKGWHVHIVLLGNRWKKARLYFILTMKNIGQAMGFRKDDAPRAKMR